MGIVVAITIVFVRHSETHDSRPCGWIGMDILMQISAQNLLDDEEMDQMVMVSTMKCDDFFMSSQKKLQ